MYKKPTRGEGHDVMAMQFSADPALDENVELDQVFFSGILSK